MKKTASGCQKSSEANINHSIIKTTKGIVMKKQNKIISLLMSALIVFSLFSPALIKAEENDTDPTEENPVNETLGLENTKENETENPEKQSEESAEEDSTEETIEPSFSFGYIPDDFINKTPTRNICWLKDNRSCAQGAPAMKKYFLLLIRST